MSSAGISFGGMASGLDTQAIIAALMAVERRPVTALETKKTALGKSKSLMSDFEGLLAKLSTASKALKTTTDFLNMKAAVEKEDYMTASASSSASPGTYQIAVKQLAKAQVNTGTGQASKSAAIDNAGGNSPELEFMVNGALKVVFFTDTSLEGIRDAINGEADLGVRAEIIDTGTAGTPYQLVLRSETTGTDGDFTVTVGSPSPGGNPFETFISGLNTNKVTDASDATIEIDGIEVTRSTNQITDAIAGVTIDLKALTPYVTGTSGPHTTTTLTISTDATATAEKVKSFVDVYNAVVDFVEKQNVVDKTGKSSSPLFGDSSLRSVRSALRTAIGSQVDTGNTAYSMLAQAGITSDTKGKLTFNQSKFETALVNDEEAVSNLFAKAAVTTGQTNPGGLAVQLFDKLDIFTDSIDGIFKARQDGFDANIKRAQTQIDQGEARLTRYEAQLKRQYANLESLLTKLQSQGSSLGGLK